MTLPFLSNMGDQFFRRKIRCARCENLVDVSIIRYDSLGRMICKNCYDKEFKKPMIKIINLKEKKNEKKVRYKCSKCGYRFSLTKSSKIKRRCPFCSSDDIKEHDPDFAERLIREV